MTEELDLGSLLSQTTSFFFKHIRFLSKYAIIITVMSIIMNAVIVLPVLFVMSGNVGLMLTLSAISLVLIIGIAILMAVVSLNVTIIVYHKLTGDEKTFSEAHLSRY